MSTMRAAKGEVDRARDMATVTYHMDDAGLAPDSMAVFVADNFRSDDRINQLSAPWQAYIRAVLTWISDRRCEGGSIGLFGASTSTEGLGARVISVCHDHTPGVLDEFPDVVRQQLAEAFGITAPQA